MFNWDVLTSYRMIDISSKKTSYRRACVFGSIYIGEEVFALIKDKKIEKGDPLILAEIAGINAVKNTSNLIILCHPINVENVFLHVLPNEKTYSIDVYSFVFAHAKTGLEMEAMLGVVIALLTIYDLTKKFNPYSYIKSVNLIFKDGGENNAIIGSLDNLPDNFKKYFLSECVNLKFISVCLVTVSDRASLGRYQDLSGKVLFDFFMRRGSNILSDIILPDDKFVLFNVLKNYIDIYSPNVIVTSGGTGISDRDITVDVINNLCSKIIPGIGEFLRFSGSFYSSNSWLSRSVAGIYKKTLIICLPGKPSAVSECLSSLEKMLLHAVFIINKV